MSDIIERQREIVARHIRGENEHDWAAVCDTFVQDDRAHYDVVPLGAVFKGIEGVRGFYQSIAAPCPTCGSTTSSRQGMILAFRCPRWRAMLRTSGGLP